MKWKLAFMRGLCKSIKLAIKWRKFEIIPAFIAWDKDWHRLND